MKDSRLKKKLKGIGFISPKKKLGEIYKISKELMASSLDENAKLKAAFFAIDIKNDASTSKEASMGIFAIGERVIYYSAIFPNAEKIGWLIFEISKLENINLEASAAEKWDGLNFEYEGKKYSLGAFSGELSTNFIRETLNM